MHEKSLFYQSQVSVTLETELKEINLQIEKARQTEESAIQQAKTADKAELAKAIAQAAPRAGALRLVRARRMAPGYHATYSTAWRHYAYLLPPPPNATRAAVAAEAAALDKLLRPLAGTQPA